MKKFEEIKTIKNNSEFKFKEKGSLFLSKSFALNDEKSAEEILLKLKKEFYDATHHCYAYKLNNAVSSDIIKYSDDGEPSGTAGIRILNAIDHAGLTNCMVIVIRYFGGTKLGVGPLGKAYYNAAIGVLDSSGIIVKKPSFKITLSCTFPLLNLAHRVLAQYDAKILNTVYENEIKFECMVDANKTEQISSAMIEASQNQIGISVDKTVIYD